MTLDEAVATVSRWGEPRVLGPRAQRSPVTVGIDLDGIGFQVHLEAGDSVTAIELWWPGEGRRSSTHVVLDVEDVFTTPAPRILERALARGWTVRTR